MFLFLLLLGSDRKNRKLLLGGLTVLAVFVLVNYLTRPELFESFINNLRALNERAEDFNYGMLAFWDDLYRSISYTANFPYRMYLAYASYGLVVFLVLLVSVRGYFKLHSKRLNNLKLYNVLYFCCVYTLIVPRFKCYSFIILIPACLILLSYRTDLSAYLILLLGIIPVSTPFYGGEEINRLFHYYPLFLAFVIWVYFIAIRNEPGFIDNKTNLIEEGNQ
jgi:hypothetical protein